MFFINVTSIRNKVELLASKEYSKLSNQKVQLKLMVVFLSKTQKQDYSSFSKKSEEKIFQIILHIGWLKKEAHTNISQVGIFLEDSCSSSMLAGNKGNQINFRPSFGRRRAN